MTNGLTLLAHWSVRQKLNRVSSVQFGYVNLRRFVHALTSGQRTRCSAGIGIDCLLLPAVALSTLVDRVLSYPQSQLAEALNAILPLNTLQRK